MKKWLPGLLLIPFLLAADGLEQLRGLVLTNVKLPVYHKQMLQTMAFCGRASQQGRLLVGEKVLLDMIRPGADIDAIKDGWGTEFYPLGATFPEVLLFWSRRLYCEGLMSTPQANIDQESRMAAGSEPVFFRSPLLDLDGIGFEADLNRRNITVKSDVHIVLRMGASDPTKLLVAGRIPDKLPAKYEFLTAESETLNIDLETNQITLTGKVIVDESGSTIHCDRLTIFLERRADAGAEERPGESMSGVSRILCDGNVVVTRKLSEEEEKEGKQQAFADHLIYDVKTGSATLSGKKPPRIVRGDEMLSGQKIVLYKDEQRATVTDNCLVRVKRAASGKDAKPGVMTIRSRRASMDYLANRGEFAEKVVVDDTDMRLHTDHLLVTLRDTGVKTEKPEPAPEAVEPEPVALTGLGNFGPSTEGRELDEIICTGKVRMIRKDAAGKLLPQENAVADRAVFNNAARKITLTGERPTLTRGNETLSGKALEIFVDEERLRVQEDSQVLIRANSNAPAGAKVPMTLITSRSSDLAYGGNCLTFKDDVKVIDPRMLLDCDKMEIYLTPTEKAVKEKAPGGLPDPDALESGDKRLDGVVCTGNVHSREPQGDLKTDRLTLFFAEVKGKEKSDSAFQSGNTRMIRMRADGNLVAVNNAAPEKPGQPTPFAKMLGGNGKATTRTLMAENGEVDLERDQAEFHRQVKVFDDQGRLECEDLYLFARSGEPETLPAVKAADNPDADPFELPTSPLIPARLFLGEGRVLERVLGQNNVIITRKTENNQVQRAGGTQADYRVDEQKIYLTGTPEKQPWMEFENRRMESYNQVVIDLETEQMFGEKGRISSTGER